MCVWRPTRFLRIGHGHQSSCVARPGAFLLGAVFIQSRQLLRSAHARQDGRLHRRDGRRRGRGHHVPRQRRQRSDWGWCLPAGNGKPLARPPATPWRENRTARLSDGPTQLVHGLWPPDGPVPLSDHGQGTPAHGWPGPWPRQYGAVGAVSHLPADRRRGGRARRWQTSAHYSAPAGRYTCLVPRIGCCAWRTLLSRNDHLRPDHRHRRRLHDARARFHRE